MKGRNHGDLYLPCKRLSVLIDRRRNHQSMIENGRTDVGDDDERWSWSLGHRDGGHGDGRGRISMERYCCIQSGET